MDYNIPSYNYIGSKTGLLHFIQSTIEKHTKKKLNEIQSIADIFSGTGAVTNMLLKHNIPLVVSNDIQHYAYVMSSTLKNDSINESHIKSLIDTLNNKLTTLEISPQCDDFIVQTYSELGKRLYFTKDNGYKIDYLRKEIQNMYNKEIITDCERLFLIKCLLYAAIKVSNVTCVYGAFLKTLKDKAKQDIKLPNMTDFGVNSKSQHTSYNMDVFHFLDTVDTSDFEVVYLDPPYSKRRYDTSYHLLETISLYDNPKVRGLTGLREQLPGTRIRFCQKTNALNDFNEMFSKIKSKYVFLSYSSDGNVSKADMLSLLKTHFTNVKCYEMFYKRVKTNNFSPETQPANIKEYIFAATRKNQNEYANENELETENVGNRSYQANTNVCISNVYKRASIIFNELALMFNELAILRSVENE